MFKYASSKETREENRDQIYNIYQKASGTEAVPEPELSYAEKVRAIRMKAKAMPKTRGQKKKLKRVKVKQMQSMKKKLYEMFQK